MCKGDSNTTLAKDNRVQRTEYRCRRGGTGVSALKRTEYNRVGASLVGALFSRFLWSFRWKKCVIYPPIRSKKCCYVKLFA